MGFHILWNEFNARIRNACSCQMTAQGAIGTTIFNIPILWCHISPYMGQNWTWSTSWEHTVQNMPKKEFMCLVVFACFSIENTPYWWSCALFWQHKTTQKNSRATSMKSWIAPKPPSSSSPSSSSSPPFQSSFHYLSLNFSGCIEEFTGEGPGVWALALQERPNDHAELGALAAGRTAGWDIPIQNWWKLNMVVKNVFSLAHTHNKCVKQYLPSQQVFTPAVPVITHKIYGTW